MNRTTPTARRDFAASTLRQLGRIGITITGTTFAPDESGNFANGARAYILDDNGTERIRNHAEVRQLAAA